MEFFDSMWGLILFAGGVFFVLVVPGLSIAAFRATQRLEREVALLRLELRNLRDRQESAAYVPHRPSHPVDQPPEPAAPPAPEPTPLPETRIEPEPAFEAAPPTPPEPPASLIAPRPVAERAPRGLEQRLGARGFVWLGGACIALAGFFLVKYSIEEGLLGPGMRVALGILLGFVLLVAGDLMRRKSGTIGQALTAAGVACLYASLYAAVALYQLIPPALAFVILAALTFVAIGLSLRHGPFVGLVGLAGGFLTPAIVSTGEPHPWILFSYLYLLQLGALWLERQRGWWYLPAIANAGGLGWALLILAMPELQEAGAIAGLAVPVYLIVVAASVLWLSPMLATSRAPSAAWPESRIVGLASAVAVALLMLLWLTREGFLLDGWVFAGSLAILGSVSGRLRPQQEIAGWALLAVPLLGLLTWNTQFHPSFELDLYLWVAGIIGVLGTGGAYALLWGARNPERWSLVSAIYGAATLAIAYWRLRDIDLLVPWSIICLILSAVHLVFAERLRNWRFKDRFYRRAFGVHALACVGFLAAAVPLWVEREWLPVLWSLLLPLIAWIANKIEEPWLRRGLWVAAPAVLIAVLVSGFPAGDRPIFNWLAYGLGVPTLCLAATAWLVRRASDLRLMLMLQAGALILGFLLVTLEVRHLFHGAEFKTAPFGFGEAGTLTLLWGVLALATWRMAQRRGEARLRWIAYGLAALSGLLTVGVVWVMANPLLNPIPIRGLPILNSALYVFGSGFLLFMAMANVARRSRLDAAQRHATTGLAGAIALVDGFLGVSALNRHLFHGGGMIYFGYGGPDWSDAEFYGYSVAWLIYGGLILALAIWRRLPVLRHAAAGIVVLVVFKVFLGDASGLTGLYRTASFLGLGVTLLALGYLYQRMLKHAES